MSETVIPFSKFDAVDAFILTNVSKHPRDITRRTMEKFKLSRPTVCSHVNRMLELKLIEGRGSKLKPEYSLKILDEVYRDFPTDATVTEDVIWRDHISPLFWDINKNVRDICQYGFSEVFNNVLEHAQSPGAAVVMIKTAATVTMFVSDRGMGVYKKIREHFGLMDEHQALIELGKGRITTDPKYHTGEGLYCTGRLFDEFSLVGNGLKLSHEKAGGLWRCAADEKNSPGTDVMMKISLFTKETLADLLRRITASGRETVFPVALLRHGDENLISRSQARRLLLGLERFERAVLDFRKIPLVGQAFADEILRVYPAVRPEVRLSWINAAPEVERTLRQARSGTQQDAPSAD